MGEAREYGGKVIVMLYQLGVKVRDFIRGLKQMERSVKLRTLAATRGPLFFLLKTFLVPPGKTNVKFFFLL